MLRCQPNRSFDRSCLCIAVCPVLLLLLASVLLRALAAIWRL
jgi:hypothetical protein